MKRMTGIAAIAALTMGAPALAQSMIDTDGDGVYSFDEMLTAVPTLTEEAFIAVDVNGDGTLDEAELAAAQEAGIIPATDG